MRATSSHRLSPRGQHDERRIGAGAEGAQRHGFVEHRGASELDDILLLVDVGALERGAQRVALELSDRGAFVDLDREIVPYRRSTEGAVMRLQPGTRAAAWRKSDRWPDRRTASTRAAASRRSRYRSTR